ncbi:MAG: hypothetical protein ACRDS0_38870 [Pseudonocardiaceae bacterium]
MLHISRNLWDLDPVDPPAAVGITTNGFVKANGACVMGRGCAREARDRWPGLDQRIGAYVRQYGNRPFRLRVSGFAPDLVTFPVKPERGPKGEPGWTAEAELPLMLESAAHLVVMADKFGWGEVWLPRPGCGNGRLIWDEVGPALADVLDDRFIAVTFPR